MGFKITGKARIVEAGLRCAGDRLKSPGVVCNKLLCKLNSQLQVAGNFRCERCHQIIEIEMTKDVNN